MLLVLYYFPDRFISRIASHFHIQQSPRSFMSSLRLVFAGSWQLCRRAKRSDNNTQMCLHKADSVVDFRPVISQGIVVVDVHSCHRNHWQIQFLESQLFAFFSGFQVVLCVDFVSFDCECVVVLDQ